MAGLVGIDRAEPLLEKLPVDHPAEFGERVIQVDDLVEPGSEKIVLSAVPPLPGPRRITLRQVDGETKSRPNGPINLQESKPADAAFLANALTCRTPETPQKSGDSEYFTDDGEPQSKNLLGLVDAAQLKMSERLALTASGSLSEPR